MLTLNLCDEINWYSFVPRLGGLEEPDIDDLKIADVETFDFENGKMYSPFKGRNKKLQHLTLVMNPTAKP